MPTADVDVGTWQRIISASIGALVTSLIVTPLDVVKTRIQVQDTSISEGIECEICGDGTKKYKAVKIKLNVNNNGNGSNCSSNPSSTSIRIARVNQNYYVFSNGLMEHRLPIDRLRIEVFESKCIHKQPFKHIFDAFYKIAKFEGIPHLYTGLGVTLWMAAPATVLYYSTYDILRNRLLKWTQNEDHSRFIRSNRALTTFIPLISGMTGRVFAATVISPLELMRTQMMARTIGADVSIREGMKLNLKEGGFFSLWKGLIPTLWRDVPFSGIYWMSYEYYKDHFMRQQSSKRIDGGAHSVGMDSIGRFHLFKASFLSGAVSGGIATILTQPFDVLKTRRQASILGIAANKQDASINRLTHLASTIVRQEGLTALYLGLPARLTRVPISCSIMVSTYEVGKMILKQTVND